MSREIIVYLPEQLNVLKSHQIISFIFLLSISTGFAQTTCEKASDMVSTIEKFHYNAKPIDSAFSEMFCKLLLDKVDQYGLFLTKKDVKELNSASYNISIDLEEKKCDFYNLYSNVLKEGISNAKNLLAKRNNERFVPNTGDSIVIEHGAYFVSSSDLENRWSKWLQYLTNKRLYGIDYSSSQIDSIYQQVLALEQCRIDSYFINNGLDDKVSEWYLSALANTFDPHTTYFSNSKKESFDDQLSDENYSFGLELNRTERGELKVASIVPGGAAWKSNSVNEGDILNAVIVKEETKDFSCIGYSEAVNFLNSGDVNSAQFIFQTRQGVIDTVKLNKTKITVQENIVQSFILSDSSRTVGYIYLPSFYSSGNNLGLSTNGCSADISREIIRLKKEGIEALIIDLRGNGGGHMLEAINLIGIFINYGTLGIIDSKDEKSSLIKDMNRGLIYDGPITVMIDEYSASASEFFAVTLQDYNRAVIVGSTSYGKSTAQSIFPIEAHKYFSPELMEEEPEGYVKVTVSRFYRVNGDTYQRQGVIPDIKLPSFYDEVQMGEKVAPSSLPPNQIERETYFSTYHTVPRQKLLDKFELRSRNSEYFSLMKKFSGVYSDYRKENKYALDLEGINEREDKYVEMLESYYAFETNSPYDVNNPAYLSGYSNMHDSEKEINALVMNDIAEDQEIIEAYFVTLDLINFKNNE
tara:strand:+ start:19348 stop:21435 length:2088 start_codon:yes stop_codon:yes gene_type:complete